jgi:hypothetical protein
MRSQASKRQRGHDRRTRGVAGHGTRQKLLLSSAAVRLLVFSLAAGSPRRRVFVQRISRARFFAVHFLG